MSICPSKANGIMTDQLCRHNFGAGQWSGKEFEFVGVERSGATFLTTGGAGTIGAQPLQGIDAGMPVKPGNAQRAGSAINSDLFWALRIHKVRIRSGCIHGNSVAGTLLWAQLKSNQYMKDNLYHYT
jgi:hypothetical protein